jgi:hypothetical protein
MKDDVYLVITVYHKPKSGVRTEKSTIYDQPDVGRRTKETSWTLNPNLWEDIEVPELVSRISKNRLLHAAVIIDVNNDKLVKNRFTKNSPEEILTHFKKKYGQYLPQKEIKQEVEVV